MTIKFYSLTLPTNRAVAIYYNSQILQMLHLEFTLFYIGNTLFAYLQCVFVCACFSFNETINYRKKLVSKKTNEVFLLFISSIHQILQS